MTTSAHAPRVAARSAFVRGAVVIAAAALAVFLVEQLVLAPVHVTSGSMRPAVRPGDRLLVARWRGIAQLHRGDIVVFRSWPVGSHHPRGSFPGRRSQQGDLLVKRVIGMPGEVIQARGGVIGIDNRRVLQEPWLRSPDHDSTFAAHAIARDAVWVEGDDRAHSRDSRTFGTVPASALVGAVAMRFWPPDRWGSP